MGSLEYISSVTKGIKGWRSFKEVVSISVSILWVDALTAGSSLASFALLSSTILSANVCQT